MLGWKTLTINKKKNNNNDNDWSYSSSQKPAEKLTNEDYEYVSDRILQNKVVWKEWLIFKQNPLDLIQQVKVLVNKQLWYQ